MMTRLQTEVNDFLIDYSICGLDMFNDWIQDSIGFTSKKCQLGNYYNKNQDIYYSAEALNLTDLHKLLSAFKVSADSYRTGQSFNLSETLIFDDLLPRFKSAVKKMANDEPGQLKAYQIVSKPELEKEAIRKIESAAHAIIESLSDQPERSKQSTGLLRVALCISGIFRQNDNRDEIESLIRLGKDALLEHVNLYPQDSSDELSQSIAALLNGFKAYETLNQVELRRITAKLLPEVEEFSRTYGITESKCDFFEEMLMRMAGITQMPTKSRIDASYSDKTRFDFSIDNMKEEDVQRFLTLFKDNGDDTAYTGKQRKRHQHISMMESAQSATVSILGDKAFHDRTDNFNVDGIVLYQKIFPEFKAFVTHLAEADPSKLVKYQEASKAFMLAQITVAQVNSSTQNSSALFQPSNTSIPEFKIPGGYLFCPKK